MLEAVTVGLGRRRRRRRCSRRLIVVDIARSLLKLAHRLTEATGHLGQLLAAKEQQHDEPAQVWCSSVIAANGSDI